MIFTMHYKGLQPRPLLLMTKTLHDTPKFIPCIHIFIAIFVACKGPLSPFLWKIDRNSILSYTHQKIKGSVGNIFQKFQSSICTIIDNSNGMIYMRTPWH